MTRAIPESHPLHRLFRGLTEHTFSTELGIADPPLVGYVADLLVRFVPAENLWRLRDAQGQRLAEVARMLAEAESTDNDQRRRECHRHVGDFTLFWTGVYPEALSTFRSSDRADHLIDYQRQGKHSYLVASSFEGEESPVLRRLSAEFEICAFGLSRVRREWERQDQENDGPGDAGPVFLV